LEAERAQLVGARQLGEETENGPLRVRTFFGLPLPEAQREALERYLLDCATRAPEFRWTPAQNLHLTIRFLGHVEGSLAEGIAGRLAEAGLRAFDLQLGELGTFKRGRLVRVVWLGLTSGGEEISALASRVEEECKKAGLEAEARRFNAHLTLARARPRDGAPLPDFGPLPELDAWRAEELILYRSHLGRAGSVYEPLRRIRLS
jgi:RNA 2',3'-cyclic 3'-phosphodiesterase